MNLTCNSTLEEMRISPGSEVLITGSLTFHELALIIGGAATAVAILMSAYLIMMHALHYTKPNEQRQIIRILFMVPTYATASFLALRFYWHAIYFQVISDCYEAFAISSFFALMCHYIAPDLHEQKEYFRLMHPIKPWVWPLNWFNRCCGGERGPWRTPASGLTWFNINWIGIYHYCFIRVFMTITAVVTQYFDRYCESSNSPVFSHIWVISINALAVTIAMYCLIQFYVQLRAPLSEHQPFLKVLAIKLVIFLSFWQSAAISVGTSTLNLVHPNQTVAYPDLKVGIPSMLLCVEMAIFAVLHLWAFPYGPYLDRAKTTFYPVPDARSGLPPKENEHTPRAGGPLGLKALWHAMNLWDVVKAFGRGVRWLFVGVKRRHQDISYHTTRKNSGGSNAPGGGGGGGDGGGGGGGGMGMGMDDLDFKRARLDSDTSYPPAAARPGDKSTDHLPIASEFRRSRYGPPEQEYLDGSGRINTMGLGAAGRDGAPGQRQPIDYGRGGGGREERVGLIAHAQPDPRSPASPAAAAAAGFGRHPSSHFSGSGAAADEDEGVYGSYGSSHGSSHGHHFQPDDEAGSLYRDRAGTLSTVDEESELWRASRYAGSASPNPRNSAQAQIGAALWGPRDSGYDRGGAG